MSTFQDWEPVNIGGGKIVNDKKNIYKSSIEKKTQNTPGNKLFHKLDNDDGSEEKIVIEKVSYNVSKDIQTKRNMAKLSQKDLAKNLNLDIKIIQLYECGKGVHDTKIMNKIEKFLKIRLNKKINKK